MPIALNAASPAPADGGKAMPDRGGADGTERLCRALYGRKATARDYLGGSNARMLHDAADRLSPPEPARAVEGPTREERHARERLEALCRLIERPPLDAVELELGVAVQAAADIRSILALAAREGAGQTRAELAADLRRRAEACRELRAAVTYAEDIGWLDGKAAAYDHAAELAAPPAAGGGHG